MTTCLPSLSPWGGNKSIFSNVMFVYKYKTMQKVQESSNPEFNTKLTHQQLFTLLTSSLDLVSNMHHLPRKNCMSNMLI